MATNFDAARELVTPALLSRMSAQTGDSEAALTKGFGAVIPMLFAALANKSDDQTFMSQVANIATDAASDINRPTYIPQAVDVSGIDTTTPTGGWLSKLFGGNLSGVVYGVTRYAGLNRGTSASLLSLAAPLVLGYLGRMMRKDGLDADGLADRLRGQRRAFESAVPSELEGLIPGITGAPSIDRDIRYRAGEAPRVATSADRWARGWVLPLVLAALALGGLFWWRGPDRAAVQTRAAHEVSRTIGTTGERTIGTTGERTTGTTRERAVGTTGERAVPSVPVVPAAPVTRFESDRTIRFENGSSSLASQSREELSTLAATLKAHPDARVQISGYTDNIGSESANVELSRSRATAVMDALHGMGTSTDRIQAEGYGSQKPIASNATAEGRAENRRVEVVVTNR
jgi:outer membrane protein OmpA-like peptidoglycan-associated protein